MERPVLLCGMGRVGWRILDHLRAARLAVTVVDLHADALDPRLESVTFIRGDCRRPDALERAGVRDCGGAIIVTSDDLVNVASALLIRKLNPDARIVVRMFNQNLLERLGGAMRNTVALSVSALTAPLLALTAVTGNAITTVKLESGPKQIAPVTLETGSLHIGKSLRDVENERELILLAHTPHENETKLWHEADRDTILVAGDTILACGTAERIAPLLSIGKDELLGTVRWAGWVRRQLRTLRRTLLAVDLSLKITGAVLAAALVATTLVFRFGLGLEWIDAFYATVGLLATGADLRREEAPAWVKFFLGTMKLAGTAIIAAFTAIFTQYLIRAKLGGALEARRIPDGGHVVVCGLGNVGFRCVEELVRFGHPVVAIDAVSESPFAATVRRMGVPVIAGSATVTAVLEQARAATAGAVIAATDSELSNLEIALLAREANPKQRVVVRLQENDFALAARESANIRHAVALPALVAPAFAAALFGDRVQALVTVNRRTLAVLEIVVQENEPHLLGRAVKDVCDEFCLLPLEAVDPGKALQVGHSVTVIVELAAMDRMLRRQ